MYQDGAYPSAAYFAALDERFADFAAQRLAVSPAELGARAGSLTSAAAQRTGLPEGIAVAVGNVDAHVTVPAAQAIDPGQMVAVMRTSTCHVTVGDQLAEVPGMCGAVYGGLVLGRWGYEAEQSGVRDIFAWLVNHAVPPDYHERAREQGTRHPPVPVCPRGRAASGTARSGRAGLVERQPVDPGHHELSGLLVA